MTRSSSGHLQKVNEVVGSGVVESRPEACRDLWGGAKACGDPFGGGIPAGTWVGGERKDRKQSKVEWGWQAWTSTVPPRASPTPEAHHAPLMCIKESEVGVLMLGHFT